MDVGLGAFALHQDIEAFLLEVPVMGEDVGESKLPHRRHADAVGEAVGPIGAGTVEAEAVQE